MWKGQGRPEWVGGQVAGGETGLDSEGARCPVGRQKHQDGEEAEGDARVWDGQVPLPLLV